MMKAGNTRTYGPTIPASQTENCYAAHVPSPLANKLIRCQLRPGFFAWRKAAPRKEREGSLPYSVASVVSFGLLRYTGLP